MIRISNLMQRGFRMRKEKSVKKINLCFLAATIVMSMCLGCLRGQEAYAEGFSLVPTGEMLEISAGQAQSFATTVNTAGVIQALDSLDGQAICQEKVCVCKYQIRVTTLKLRADEVVEQIGMTDSVSYDCRDIKGGVGPAELTYGVSIAEPGTNYYLNIAQIVTAEGASFGAEEGNKHVLGDLEVHQVNVIGGDSVTDDPNDTSEQEVDVVETASEEPNLDGAMEDDGAELSAVDEDWEDVTEGSVEFILATTDVAMDVLTNALAEEPSNVFTVKVEDSVVLSSTVLEAVKASGKNLSIKKYQDEQLIYEWKIRNDAIDVTRDFDPTVSFGVDEKSEIDQAVSELETMGDLSKMYFGTAQVGALPAGTKLRVLVDDLAENAERLNLYNYDADLSEVEVAYESIKVNNGYAEFVLARGSQGYFLTPAQIVTVQPEEVATEEEREAPAETNWLLWGFLGVIGTGGIGFAGFWVWKRYRKSQSGSDDVCSVVANEEINVEEEDDSSAVEQLELPARSVVAKVNMIRSVEQKNAGKVMDMVRGSQEYCATENAKMAVRGSARRLVIS